MEKKFIENDIMSLGGTFIKELTENFSTSHSLDLTDSLIEKLPDNLMVAKDLIIGNAKIKELPKNTRVGRNLIMLDNFLPIPADIIIGGNIITKNAIIEPPFQKNNMLIVNNKRISYRKKKICYNERIVAEDFYYPQVYYYYGIDPQNSAIEFSENGKTYIFPCKNLKEGFYKIDWQRAENFGIRKYQDYNVDEFRTVEELKEIYQTCTGACESGIIKFKKLLNIDDNSLYTIRQLGDMVSKLDWVRGSVVIFFKFFNLKYPRFEKEAD